MGRIQPQQMTFRCKDHVGVVRIDPRVLIEKEEQILCCLREDKRFLAIDEFARVEIGERGETAGNDGSAERLENLSSDVEVKRISGRSVKIPSAFDEFWTKWVPSGKTRY